LKAPGAGAAIALVSRQLSGCAYNKEAIRPAATSLHLSNVMARDVAYFQSHATGGERTTFAPLPLDLKLVDYGCNRHAAPPIQVFMDRE
jgi:hypothetical protein